MTGTTSRFATVAVALLLVTAGVVPAVGADDLSSPPFEVVPDSVAANDDAVTTTPATTTSTATTTSPTTTGSGVTTTAGNDATTSVTTEPGDSGLSDDDFRRANASNRDPSISSRVADVVEAAESERSESGLVTQAREETFVTVVLEAAGGRDDEAAAAARRGGGSVTHRYEDLVQVRLPAGAVEAVADAPSVEFVRTPRTVEPSSVTSDGGLSDLNVSDLHDRGNTGENVTIAVVDVGFDATNPEIADNVVETKSMQGDFTNQSSAHGTAVSELIVDAAPNVSLVLVEVTYVTDILDAADYVDERPAIDAVSMSLGVKSGPWDGSARLDRRIDTSVERGTPWFVSAGNEGNSQHYNTTWSDTDGDGYLNFDGTDETINVTPRCDSCSISVSWNDYPDSNEDYDVWLYDDDGNVLDSSTTVQDGSQPPEESVFVSSPPSRMHLVISAQDANGTAHFQIFGSGRARFEYTTSAMTLTRPATAKEVVAVGAMNEYSDALEPFSSRGPTIDGRRGVDLTAPDNVTTTARDAFYGTSAAAPYASGVAALVIGATDESLSPAEVERALESTATDLRGDEPNPATGHGLIDASAAVGSVVVSATPSALDFGDRRVDETVAKNVTVTNDRSAPLEITGANVSGADASAFAATSDASGSVLGPGESLDVTVEFAPSAHGEKAAELVVSHNDSVVSPTTVSLSGTGLTPVANVAPTGHDYGDVGVVLGNETVDVAVTNDGNVPLNVTALDVTGADADEFEIDAGDGTPEVAPGETHDVSVSFTPDSMESKSANLSVEHNDTDASPTTVSLAGRGVDKTGPALGDATITDATDGNAVVADGDAVTVAVNATDVLGSVDSVEVDASAFGAGTVVLSDPDGDGRYDATFAVNGSAAGADGDYALDVTATDGKDNRNSTATSALTLDTTAPELTITDPANESATNASAIRVAGTVTDDASATGAVEINATDAWTDATVSGDGTWNGSTDAIADEGTYVVRVRATDIAGNTGSEETVTVTVDRTDPTFDNPRLGRTDGVRPEADLTVATNASDSVTEVAAVVANDTALAETSQGGWSGTVEADPSLGEHAVTVSIRDSAGNTEERTLEYDVGVETNLTEQNGTLVAAPDRGAVENVTINATGDTSNAAAASNETVVVGASATNPTDVASPNETALSFPQVNTSVTNANVSDASFAVTVPRSRVESKFALLDTVRFWVREGESWGATNGTLVAENDTHLTYEMNTQHFSTFSVTADTDATKPTVSSLGPADGATVETQNASVTANFSDDYAGVDTSEVVLRVDGRDATGESTVSTTGVTYDATLSNGTHSVSVVVPDRAGNTRVREWSFTVDPAASKRGGGGGSGGGGGGGAGGGGGSGGGGGGGGADVPPPMVQVELTETTESSVRAEVTSARADAAARIVPDESITAGDVGVQRVEVTPQSEEPLPRFFVTVAATNRMPDGAPSIDALGFVEMETANIAPSSLDAVSIEFTVPASTTAVPENVVLYRSTGSNWETVETTVVAQRNDQYALEASAAGIGPFAVGVRSPDLSIADASVNASSAEVGSTVEITATVENTGEGTGSTAVALTADGGVVEQTEVSLPAGESRTVTFDVTFDSSGERELAVDGVSAGTVSVEEPTTEVAVTDATETEVTATPERTEAGEVDKETTRIGGGGSGSVPGFDPTAALVALLAGMLVLRYRN